MSRTIRNPLEWAWDQLAHAAHGVEASYRSLHHIQDTIHSTAPAVRRIRISDVRDALRKGWEDFAAYRTDVIFLCVIYPVVGLVLGWLAFGNDLLPLLFPLASGFALVGPFAAVGLYEMSRLREKGEPVNWANALAVFRSPNAGAITVLGVILIAIFLLWLLAAWMIYNATLGPDQPASLGAFAADLFGTRAGWTLIGLGNGVGFLFALLAMAISVVSFPLLVDRDVGLDTAIATSIRAVIVNPVPMAVWGLAVAAGLILGSLPFFVGLIVVVPVLGHATWHLYRRLVAR